eukprot:scaffold60351_cov53-Phaeocystis_antarctica.AAC.1
MSSAPSGSGAREPEAGDCLCALAFPPTEAATTASLATAGTTASDAAPSFSALLGAASPRSWNFPGRYCIQWSRPLAASSAVLFSTTLSRSVAALASAAALSAAAVSAAACSANSTCSTSPPAAPTAAGRLAACSTVPSTSRVMACCCDGAADAAAVAAVTATAAHPPSPR